MSVKKAYDTWSDQYDTNINATRDLEATAIQKTLGELQVDNCLEIGCGTGKNTAWLVNIAKIITSVDLSADMLAKAQEKIKSPKVNFIQADVLEDWHFAHSKYNLVCFSLVLEHIENLESIFEKISKVIAQDGCVYIGELHPYKQYNGTRARYTTDAGEELVTCYNHNLSDFTNAAKKHGFKLVELQEFFDGDDRNTTPRIITLLFKFQ